MGESGDDFFAVMGSDARTPLGAGNLSLVAGGITFQRDWIESDVFGSFDKVTLTPPTPSLSPVGVAVAVALVLLAAGYALRKRFRS